MNITLTSLSRALRGAAMSIGGERGIPKDSPLAKAVADRESHLVIPPQGKSPMDFEADCQRWNELEESIARDLEVSNQIIAMHEKAEALHRVKSLLFMRLNSARDRRDKKAISILEEIMEATR
jgi:hypothetical protein